MTVVGGSEDSVVGTSEVTVVGGSEVSVVGGSEVTVEFESLLHEILHCPEAPVMH